MKKLLKHLWFQVTHKTVELSAVIVACCALYISISQAMVQKEIERTNKQPFLQIEHIKLNSEVMKGLKLSNLGNGPAVIKSFKIYPNKQEFLNGNAVSTFLPKMNNSLGFYFERINNLISDYAIAEKNPDKEIFLLGTTADSVFYNDQNEFKGEYFNSNTAKDIDDMIIEIEYKSFYELDKNTYYLKYGEKQSPTNLRKVIH